MSRKDTRKKIEKDQLNPTPEQQSFTRSQLARKKYAEEREERAKKLKEEQAARKEKEPKWLSQRSAQEAKDALGRFVEDNESKKQQASSVGSEKEAPKHERSSTSLPSPNNSSRSFAPPSTNKGAPIEFYCWKDGKVGTVMLSAMGGFSEL